jgi:hypothetical protein
MRQPFDNHHGLTGNAIAGIHVVFFGLDLAPGRAARVSRFCL